MRSAWRRIGLRLSLGKMVDGWLAEDSACYEVFGQDDTPEGIRCHGENEGDGASMNAPEIDAEVKVPEWE